MGPSSEPGEKKLGGQVRRRGGDRGRGRGNGGRLDLGFRAPRVGASGFTVRSPRKRGSVDIPAYIYVYVYIYIL